MGNARTIGDSVPMADSTSGSSFRQVPSLPVTSAVGALLRRTRIYHDPSISKGRSRTKHDRVLALQDMHDVSSNRGHGREKKS